MAGLFGAALVAPAGAASNAVDDPPEQIVNGDFSGGSTAPWWWTANNPAAVLDGRLCADIPGGTTNPWDAIIGQNDLPLIAGESYTLGYTATASVPVTITTNVQMATEPYTTELSEHDQLGDTAVPITHTFTAQADNDAAQLSFQVGGSSAPYTLCLDDVSLRGGAAPPVYTPDTGSPVRVDQVGYLPHGPKDGTFVTDATDAQTWTLKNAAGTAVATGATEPGGVDPTSGQNVQTFDFSGYTTAGDGYTVAIGDETSEPFAIADDVYSALRTDSLAYYYDQRSGIAIDGAIAGAAYARPAGHLNVAPNTGDNDVPCQPGVCDYTLDAAGGWYDAGDQGKYVVNGGIAVSELMNTYERTLTAKGANGAALGDGRLKVPETGNGVPDILDEARWELNFLMEMQVPDGRPLAGMAHHKLHDQAWTGLPQAPDQDSQPRRLHPPSTAATLNLAAAGAQCARLFRPYDAAFADRCLAASQKAWTAAKAHPAVYADPDDAIGGGAYSDDNVTDEFYWAASELFITTGDDTYRQAVLTSPLHGDTAAVFPPDGFSWGSTAALGALDLATVPNKLTGDQLTTVRAMVTGAADGYAADSQNALYGLPYSPSGNHYVWGSNSQVLNNAVVLGIANDLTGETKYRDAVLHALDYILGRNPLNQSYVTGFGERNSHNQHSRIWAHQLDAALPNPPAGTLAGGPDNQLEDPTAQKKLTGCAPAMCYIDDIQSYSTNESAINWNAPLAWVASYVDDLGSGAGDNGGGKAACQVTYTSYRWSGGFTTQVALKNTGTAAVTPWELTWSFADNQKVTDRWQAEITQSGQNVSAKPVSWNGVIPPGATVGFGFNGTSSGQVSDPKAFTLNGGTCDTAR
ncbi:glycoside hydrolase family 9 protein [Streptomyces cocklensis]|uniref:glycoside hydrolase family 9 protein n=1 Tax=Actinacidiphila cocklensis TaxID=887465 RepID=UPI002040ACD2|nr:glycoside hydrolase family 9 protein [Actinacidiphila cocklensis]MDD1058628.1 glycoside hydrolase family 9 protein [Actinacidiphila cocklensis]